MTGRSAGEIQGNAWKVLPGIAAATNDDTKLGSAILNDDEFIGTFRIENGSECLGVDAWSNVIENDEGVPLFRFVALAATGQRIQVAGEQDKQLLRDKDVLLRELQHLVKNNLQMITALIRMEARNLPESETGERFQRLAGRINSLAQLYDLLSDDGASEGIDLGVYLSKVAAVEGVRLMLQVDTWPVSIDVAMPTGLVVNEIMTNAFEGRDGGTITLSCLVDEPGCRVVISDDGVGLPEGKTWPQSGKLGNAIAESLKENAKATIDVSSVPDEGLSVVIFFARKAAEPS